MFMKCVSNIAVSMTSFVEHTKSPICDAIISLQVRAQFPFHNRRDLTGTQATVSQDRLSHTVHMRLLALKLWHSSARRNTIQRNILYLL
jgi:hypothetical protein